MLLAISALGNGPLSAASGQLTEISEGPRLRLSLPDLEGRQRGLDELAGKVVLVNFWASWCRPCLDEMPSIQRLAAEMSAKRFAVLGVNVEERQRRVEVTVQRQRIDFPVLLDADGAVFKAWGATVLPTTYVLDRSGRVRYLGQGPLDWSRADIVHMLSELAEQPFPEE
jgi:thiol-disulfide isomerase/thioredoxin